MARVVPIVLLTLTLSLVSSVPLTVDELFIPVYTVGRKNRLLL